MKKKTIFILLITMLATSILAYSLASFTGIIDNNANNINNTSPPSLEPIVLEGYSGWNGVENMVTPLDEYIRAITGGNVMFSDLLWPHTDSPNPFRDLVDRGVGIAIVTVLSIECVDRYYDSFVSVVYKAKIDKVIVKPVNTIIISSQTECIKAPELCELAEKQSKIIDEFISAIREDNTIELLVSAFIAKDSMNKTALTISDIASPFPLLEPGYQYLVFLKPEPFGIIVHGDYVWGPWAYLILNGRVYSLNYVKPPS